MNEKIKNIRKSVAHERSGKHIYGGVGEATACPGLVTTSDAVELLTKVDEAIDIMIAFIYSKELKSQEHAIVRAEKFVKEVV